MLKIKPLRVQSANDGQHLLNVGCGGRFHREWNNVDLFSADGSVKPYNVLKGLPFDDGVFDGVYCSHFLEHVSWERVERMLREMRRVLKPGGVLRIVVPDLEYQAKLYLECLEKARLNGGVLEEEHYDWATIALLDQMTRESFGGRLAGFMVRQDLTDVEFIRRTLAGTDIDDAQATGALKSSGHNGKPLKTVLAKILKRVVPSALRTLRKRIAFLRSGENHKWMYDEFSMARMLRNTGFVQITRQNAVTSGIPAFDRYGLDTDRHGVVRKPNSLFMEAVKP